MTLTRMLVCPGHRDVKEGPPSRMSMCPPFRHPREIGDPVQQVKQKTGFPISLRRFGNDADTDVGVSLSHGCEGGTATRMSMCPPIRHPRDIGEPVQQVNKKIGFPISLRRFRFSGLFTKLRQYPGGHCLNILVVSFVTTIYQIIVSLGGKPLLKWPDQLTGFNQIFC